MQKREIRNTKCSCRSEVVNVKVANIRPKWDNLKEFCEDPDNLYIGRRGIVFVNKERYPKQDSKWCNPFKVTKKQDRETCCSFYMDYIIEKIIDDPVKYDINELRNKRLGCWCCPLECHGDYLIKIIRLWDKYQKYCKKNDEAVLDISSFLSIWFEQ